MKQRLLSLLHSTGIYNITPGSPIDRELEAYTAGFDMFFNELAAFYADGFISTAGTARIVLLEQLYGCSRPQSLPLEKRREFLLKLTGIDSSAVSLSGLQQALLAAGVVAVVKMDGGVLQVTVTQVIDDISTEAFINAQIARLLPAGAEYVIHYTGPTWDDFDLKERTFDELDQLNLDWNKIDKGGF